MNCSKEGKQGRGSSYTAHCRLTSIQNLTHSTNFLEGGSVLFSPCLSPGCSDSYGCTGIEFWPIRWRSASLTTKLSLNGHNLTGVSCHESTWIMHWEWWWKSTSVLVYRLVVIWAAGVIILVKCDCVNLLTAVITQVLTEQTHWSLITQDYCWGVAANNVTDN